MPPDGRSSAATSSPYAAPGIFTGTVLSLARAFGETAPILLVGAVGGGFDREYDSVGGRLPGRYTALPTMVYGWARNPPTFSGQRERRDPGAPRRTPPRQRASPST